VEKKMKFAFSSNAFRRYGLLETIRIVAEQGYEGIEIMADVPHAYPEHLSHGELVLVAEALQARRLEISNINAFMHHADGDTYHPTWIERNPVLRAKRIDYTLRCIDLAAALGAKNLSTEPGGPLEGMDRDGATELFLEGLLAVTEHARENKVRILVEPEPGLLIENSRQFLELFKHLDSEVFGLNFDVGHFFCVGEDPAALVHELKDVIHHFHLEDIDASRRHHHLLLGDGAIDLPRVLESIDGSGYRGFVTVELYTYEDRPVEAARSALKYLRRWQNSPRSNH
jgi:protein FrlC